MSASDVDEQVVTRKTLLRWGMWGSFLLFSAQFAAAFVNFFWAREVSAFGGELAAGHIDDYPVGSVTRLNDGQCYLVRLDQGFIALYWKCPHLGCTVDWYEQHYDAPAGHFHCPCHQSTYDRRGTVTGGPATRPMDLMKVTIEPDGHVVVDTGAVIERQRVSPEDFVQPV